MFQTWISDDHWNILTGNNQYTEFPVHLTTTSLGLPNEATASLNWELRDIAEWPDTKKYQEWQTV